MSSEGLSAAATRGNRCPCVPIALSFGTGIALDHCWHLPRVTLFAAAVFVLAVLGGLAIAHAAKRRHRVGLLLLLFALLGAASHGAAWRDRGVNSVIRRLGELPQLATVTGTVESAPRIERRRESGRQAAWPLEDRTIVVVALNGVSDGPTGRQWIASGRVRMTVAGHLIHLAPGDRFEATGWLSLPPTPRNPGGFDLCDYLRKHGIDAILAIDHPDAVRRVASPGFHWRRSIAAQRERLSILFARFMSAENGPVGAAMILGDRSTMPLELRDAYVASGAMHILAISGLNVGILAVFLLAIGRLLNFGSVPIAGVIVVCIWFYVLLTNLEPPVVRAAIFLTIWSLATLVMRRSSLLNVVAVTALGLVIYDPLLAFDVGAQLSFLAVIGMTWSLRALPTPALEHATEEEAHWLWRWWRPFVAAQVVGIGIWFCTAPLIASEFEIVSPVGVPLNVVLIPLATVVMWSGYLFFAVCLLMPQAAAPFGSLFDFGLTVVNALVEYAGNWRFGHLWVPAPPAWWLAGFYLLLACDLLLPLSALRRLRRWSILLAWSVVGLVPAVVPSTNNEVLRVTTLDVGHGGAILIETPGGRNMLFDCGSMEDNHWPAEAVWDAVRLRGTTRIDAVVLSHADLDHCNNVPALLHGGHVGTLIVARSFLDFEQPVVGEACEAAREADVPIRLVAEGSSFRLDHKVEIEVLHPSDRQPGVDDNANSIVLRIRYGGRTLLLTGDVEGSGQEELFTKHPEGQCDVLFAPHHGGLKANTWELAEWAQPDVVIVSASRRVNEPALTDLYRNSRLYLTPRHGAITLTIRETGWMGVE